MNAAENTKIIYQEEQRLRQIWIWIVVLFVTGLAWYGSYQQLILGEPFGSNPAPDWMMAVIWVVFGIGFPLIFVVFRLRTEVRPDGVYLKFAPVQRSYKIFPAAEIERAEVEKYKPIREYGGWGWRFGKKGKAYSISGRRGVVLHFKEGSRILIGTKKPHALLQAVQNILSGP